MASEPKTMESLTEVIKLYESGCKIKEIERRTGIARNTIRKYLRLLEGRPLANLPPNELAVILFESDHTDARGERFNALHAHFKNCSND
jgi:predicted transcriptional regulator